MKVRTFPLFLILMMVLTAAGAGAKDPAAGKIGSQDVTSITASSVLQENTSAKAFDKNFETRWESNHGVDPSWLQIDFKRKVTLSSMLITWEGASAKKYSIQVGQGKEGWTDAASVDNGEAGEEKFLKFKPVKTDRVRIYCTERATQWGYSIWEIEMNPVEPVPAKPVDLKAGDIPFQNPALPEEQRIENLLSYMTLEEKIAEMTGKDTFDGRTNTRLGIPPLLMADGPHGIRYYGIATCYPSVVAGASWDDDLIRRIGVAIAEEARAKGRNLVLGPCINIHRTPLGGRNFESYSEDPYLAGRMAVAYIKGVQSEKIGTSVKHFACNNQEWERDKISVEISERALREIYLPAFEAAVKEGNATSVMGAYNKINGEYCCENTYLLTDILKNEWGFKGFVVSDWGAIHGTEKDALAGSDLEMGGPGYFFTKAQMRPAIRRGIITEAVIDEKVKRILHVKYQLGLFDGVGREHKGSENTKEHQALVREVAENGMVLLKNEGAVLPLDTSKLKSIAVIGPNAVKATLDGGGSSEVTTPYIVGALEAIRNKCGDKVSVKYAKGSDFPEDWIDATVKGKVPKGAKKVLVKCTSREMSPGTGLSFVWFDNGSIKASPKGAEMLANGSFENGINGWKITGNTGMSGAYGWHYYEGKISAGMGNDNGPAGASGDITQSVDIPAGVKPGDILTFATWVRAERNYTGKAGLALEFLSEGGDTLASSAQEAFSNKEERQKKLIDEAVRTAKSCDAAVIIGGLSKYMEGEGIDRANMLLPKGEDELIQAVAKANRNTVVVLINGSPVDMSKWIDTVPSVLEAFYPGQEGGNAIASVLFGDVNPSGKLPMTFPKKLEDNPSYGNYPGKDGKVEYAEDIFIGYRHYDTRNVEPLFPFGHGLSYTEFEYSNLKLERADDGAGYPVKVSVDVRNTGAREGKEVVQVYVRDVESSLERPAKELKSYRKVGLKPGEMKTVSFELDKRAFSFYDPAKKKWVIEPGKFEILAGSSSRDIRAKGVFTAKNGTEF